METGNTGHGAVLSDEGIREALAAGHIAVKVLKDGKEIGAAEGDFEDAVTRGEEIPPGAIEAAGLALWPARYWDGSQFRSLSAKQGFVVRPGTSVVLESRQHLRLSTKHCALHFGLHHNQMAGIFVATGQIQPGWGRDLPTPLYVRISNEGTTTFVVRRNEPISRLVFFELTSSAAHRGGTSATQVLEPIKRELEEQSRAERVRLWRRLGILVGLLALGIFLFFLLPNVIPSLKGSDAFRPLAVLVLSPIFLGIWQTAQELWPILKAGSR